MLAKFPPWTFLGVEAFFTEMTIQKVKKQIKGRVKMGEAQNLEYMQGLPW